MHKQKYALITFLISYTLILFFPLSIMCFTYINIEDVLREQTSEYYEKLLQQNQQTADSVVSDLINIMIGVSHNNEMLRYVSYDNNELEAERYNIINNRSLYLRSEFYNIIDDMFVYYRNMDYVVGMQNCSDLKSYYNTRYLDYFEDYSQWHNFITQKHSMQFISTNKNKSDDIFFINSIMGVGDDMPEATVVFKIKAPALLNNVQKDDNIFFCIVNENDEILLSSALSNVNEIEAILGAENSAHFYTSFKFNEYIILKTESTQVKWKYGFCISKNQYQDKVSQTRRVIMLGIVFCLLIGTVLIIYLARRQYAPIKKITSKLVEIFGVQGEKVSEYQYIENAIERIMKETGDHADGNYAEELALKELSICKLLKGERCNEKIRKTVGNFLRFNNFLVMVLTFEELDRMFFEDKNENEAENKAMARFIVFNVLKDILNDGYDIETCDVENNQVIIISIENPENYDNLHKGLCQTQNIIETNFNIKLIISLSEIHIGLEELATCYDQARECSEYVRFSADSILMYSNVVINRGVLGYYYPLQKEHMIITTLKSGNYEKASEILQNIMVENFSKSDLTPMNARCFMYDILATMLKVLNELEGNNKEMLVNKLRDVEQCNTIDGMRSIILEIFMEICGIAKTALVNSHKRLSDQIVNFVELNYYDINLCVASVAESLNMSPDYLTKVVKQQIGMTLSEHISMVRNEKAKTLLTQSNCKLEDIALRVGYTSVRTFSRAFTKYMGLSPGAYRKIAD